jgi:hypothetical protein
MSEFRIDPTAIAVYDSENERRSREIADLKKINLSKKGLLELLKIYFTAKRLHAEHVAYSEKEDKEREIKMMKRYKTMTAPELLEEYKRLIDEEEGAEKRYLQLADPKHIKEMDNAIDREINDEVIEIQRKEAATTLKFLRKATEVSFEHSPWKSFDAIDIKDREALAQELVIITPQNPYGCLFIPMEIKEQIIRDISLHFDTEDWISMGLPEYDSEGEPRSHAYEVVSFKDAYQNFCRLKEAEKHALAETARLLAEAEQERKELPHIISRVLGITVDTKANLSYERLESMADLIAYAENMEQDICVAYNIPYKKQHGKGIKIPLERYDLDHPNQYPEIGLLRGIHRLIRRMEKIIEDKKMPLFIRDEEIKTCVKKIVGLQKSWIGLQKILKKKEIN